MKNIWLQYNQTLIPSSQFAEACLLVSCRVLFYTERNSELFSLPRNGSERNFENLRLFLVQGTEFQVVFSSAEGFGTELREYASIFVPRNGIPSCYLLTSLHCKKNLENIYLCLSMYTFYITSIWLPTLKIWSSLHPKKCRFYIPCHHRLNMELL